MILREHAIKKNISYIETMLSLADYAYPDQSFDEHARKSTSPETLNRLFDAFTAKIAVEKGLIQKISAFAKSIEEAHEGIDNEWFVMRYQTYASRNGTPGAVFSALYAAFSAQEKISLLVGVNFLGPENELVALAKYNLHMLMLSYLRKKLPNVNAALHAVELALGMVPPKNLTCHIHQAVFISGA
jgi:adenosine deaminase